MHKSTTVQGHITRKSLGQHFLCDPTLVDAIIHSIQPKAQNRLVEIGPGLGVLTLPLLKQVKHMVVVEIDPRLVIRLQQRVGLEVIQSDVLQVNFAKLPVTPEQKLTIVGNLPYYLSSPILFHLVKFTHYIEDQYLMLQTEVANRLLAPVDTSAYGRLSVLLQWLYKIKKILDIGPASFTPPPKVQSTFIQMRVCKNNIKLDLEILQTIVKVAFSQRRKLLRHTLGVWLEENHYDGYFDLQRRAQEVSVEEYVALTQAIKKAK